VGEVSRADFVALASNAAPRSEEQLTVRTKDNRRRAGYDFTFSLPKSVSVYLAVSGDKEVERMIHEAFCETMADIEGRVETRVRIAGQDSERLTGNMVYASFVHTVTRPVDGIPDPHYHIHTYVFNATFDPKEERWKAGQFGGLKREAPFFEAAFNSRLAEKLVQAGYSIRRTDRDFELSSVSRELVEKSSKRTQLLEQLAREKYAMLAAFGRPSERLRIARSHPDHLYLLE
jgi:conjugative relaxase-like TrwC/TraI family protein